MRYGMTPGAYWPLAYWPKGSAIVITPLVPVGRLSRDVYRLLRLFGKR